MTAKEEVEENAAPANTESEDTDTADDEEEAAVDMEARAIAEAMQSADASYVPSPSLLSADDSAPLLAQVDGPDLTVFNSTDCVYQAKGVPV